MHFSLFALKSKDGLRTSQFCNLLPNLIIYYIYRSNLMNNFSLSSALVNILHAQKRNISCNFLIYKYIHIYRKLTHPFDLDLKLLQLKRVSQAIPNRNNNVRMRDLALLLEFTSTPTKCNILNSYSRFLYFFMSGTRIIYYYPKLIGNVKYWYSINWFVSLAQSLKQESDRSIYVFLSTFFEKRQI